MIAVRCLASARVTSGSTTGRSGMNRGAALGFVALVSTVTAAHAQTPVERGRYLVDTIMTCHNCHTPMGPNGPQFDKALSGGLRFNEPPFDVTASNITPDAETGIGKWGAADVKKALLEGVRPRVITWPKSCQRASTRF